ncbi:MAG: T9SS type A sorting domain-containing protein [Bacteroidota bacterium]
MTISGGDSHTLALQTDSTLWTWGYNGSGQLGDGTNLSKIYPNKIGSADNWKYISGGAGSTMALKSNGTLWVTGQNQNGNLGDGTTIDKNVLTQIGIGSNWRLIAAGELHSEAMQNDGNLWSFGNNFSGQLGDGSNVNKSIPVLVNCSSVGLEELMLSENLFSIFPNPANELLYVKNETSQSLVNIVVIDISGRLILEQPNNITELNVRNLQPGMYFIQFLSEGKKYQKKFIKQ